MAKKAIEEIHVHTIRRLREELAAADRGRDAARSERDANQRHYNDCQDKLAKALRDLENEKSITLSMVSVENRLTAELDAAHKALVRLTNRLLG